MSAKVDTDRPRLWAPIGLGFLVGLLIGWFVLGWWAWPLSYKPPLAKDLRPEERSQYLYMVADLYGQEGNLEQAKLRVNSWTPAQLADDLDALAQSTSPDAANIKKLAAALNPQGGAGPVPTAQPTPTPVPGNKPGLSWKGLCVTALWILLILAGIVSVLWLYNRWRSSRSTTPSPDLGSVPPIGPRRTSVRPGPQSAASSGRRPSAAPEEPIPPFEESSLPRAVDELDADRLAYTSEATQASSATPAVEPRVAPSSGQFRRPLPAPGPAAGGAGLRAGEPSTVASIATQARIGDFHAAYRAGESDYDEAFDLADSSGAYIGQCGLELTDPIGRGHDQAAALQVWLWDSNDPDTKVKVLISEGAYRDTALRDQLVGEHEAIVVRPGKDFALESYQLLLRGTVDNVSYADQLPPNGVLAELQVRLQIFRKA